MTALRRTPAWALATLIAGCAVPRPFEVDPARTPSIVESSWIREIAPFPVAGPGGVAYEMPFLGGFNVPRPQLADIDGDGDQDLFVQERSGSLLFFENEGGATPRPAYRWRQEAFSDLEIGEWYRFVDIDTDGDLDLLAEERFSHIRLYRNIGGPREPLFQLAADTLRDDRGEPIFSDRQNIPNAADIDCDGRLDLLLGRLVGTVTRYEAAEAAGSDPYTFRLITDRFENIEIVGSPEAVPGGAPRVDQVDPLGAGPPPLRRGAPWARHGANTMALADVDEDGDIDLFWGDFFEPGILFIENSGTCLSANLQGEPAPFPPEDPIRTSGYNAPTLGDVDGDGDLDLLIGVLGGAFNPNTTTVENLLYVVQTEAGRFRVETRTFLSQLDVGSESVPTLVDIDGDADLDLLVGNRVDPEELTASRIYLLENVGSVSQPAFRWRGQLEVGGAFHSVPAFGDLDGDGDLDILLGSWLPELQYVENIGSRTDPQFQVVDSAFVRLPRGSNTVPTLGDIDADGDLDLFVGESNGTLNFFENVGSYDTPQFELRSEEHLDIDVGRRSFPLLIDVDADGDLDLAVGTETGGIAYYENRGYAAQAVFVEAASPFPAREDLPILSTPSVGDLDGDARAELMVGGLGGGIHYYEQP